MKRSITSGGECLTIFGQSFSSRIAFAHLALAFSAKTDNAFTQLRTMSDKKPTATELLDNLTNDPNGRLRIRLAVYIKEQAREAERLEREVIEGLHQQEMQ